MVARPKLGGEKPTRTAMILTENGIHPLYWLDGVHAVQAIKEMQDRWVKRGQDHLAIQAQNEPGCGTLWHVLSLEETRRPGKR
jgi:hypothetical protein